MIEQATLVVVGNEWTKADVIKAYPDAAKKVKNVPVMPQLSQIRNLYSTPKTGRFNLIYPASYWLHKNHKNLFHAISILKNLSYDVHLTCTGARLRSNPTLIGIIESLGIASSINLMGFVTRQELDELYSASDLLVMPSFFESESLPIWEAFSYGIPVAASNITAIPSQIDGAGILFDPNSPKDIAQAIIEIISNEKLRNDLSCKAKARISKLTHKNTLSGYRTYYRLAAGVGMDLDDTEWLKNGFVF
jgi:glycosyltransferase involved in cell wall biosynthesis